ncbi:MAG TPA: 2-oxoacid:acceptor oxidoreductase subunit alpha [Gammaproteobacteria bacterium]|nr:2-oxoacid:acceptor oxidoreductase subunit alpha [Gammaproteobacteria bacterium]
MATIPQTGIKPSISIAILGSGGSGVMTTGSLLLDVAGRAGWYGMMTRSAGPQIRGGEAAALLRLSPQPTETHKDHFDVLLALDWLNADRFVSEVDLNAQSLVIGDEGKVMPGAIAGLSGNHFELPLSGTAKSIKGGRINMVALGALAAMIGLTLEDVIKVLTQSLQRKGPEAINASISGIQAGSHIVDSLPALPTIGAAQATGRNRWSITGNEATGLGAIRGGIRFVAAYPITPATEVLEWMAPTLQKVGGVLVQAEDELASINHLIGSSFGGTPSMTATSGPGLSLMTESIGLAVASETPLVIVDVMRGGPSTGIPTKSEQSDLNIALYGLHGDAPHLVVAPNSVGDCVFTTQWATHLAETLQTACIMLSDQFMGQTRAIIDRPADIAFVSGGRQLASKPDVYFRYAVNDSGISPMSLPGTPDGQYTGDGLEHSPSGTPSSRADDHIQQLDKRKRKLDQFNYGDHWALTEGSGEMAVITWGSSTGAVQEALATLRAQGQEVRLVSLRLLSPIQPERLQRALQGVRRILVVEQCHGAQFYHYLRAFYQLPGVVKSMAIPGPLMIKPSDIYHELQSWESV